MVYDMFDFLDDWEQFPTSGHFSQEPQELQIWRGIPYNEEPMPGSYGVYSDDDYDYQEENW